MSCEETYTWDDLFDLAEPWEETFGEALTYGFEIGPSQVPLLKRCIEERFRGPLERYVADKLKDGRVY